MILFNEPSGRVLSFNVYDTTGEMDYEPSEIFFQVYQSNVMRTVDLCSFFEIKLSLKEMYPKTLKELYRKT